MQYLLNEREYSELKRNEAILNNIKQYISDSSECGTDIAYTCIRNGESIPFSVVGTAININPFKILKMLDIKLDSNIVINIVND